MTPFLFFFGFRVCRFALSINTLKQLKNRILIRILMVFLMSPGFFLTAQKNNDIQEISRYIFDDIPIDNQNWNISRNPVNGFVYFANSEGLGEYNGISLKMYTLPFKKSIRSVCVSHDGKIYTGSFEEFGYWKDTTGGNLVYKSLSKDISVEKNDEIWKIYEFRDKIYFQSFTTVYCYDHKNIRLIKAPYTMLFLFSTGDKFIGQVLGNGLYRFDGERFDFIPGSEIFKWTKVHSIIRYSENILWICTANNGIYLFDGNRFTHFDSEISTFLAYQTCNAGLSVYGSFFVFGTISDGVVICDHNGRIIQKFNYAGGLRNNTVLSLYRDENNGLWIGLDDGAAYINLHSARTMYANSSGNLGTIYTVLRDSDRLYLGTNHGLFEAEIKNNSEDYSFINLKLIPRTQEQVWTIEKYDDQIVCGHNDGTFILEGDNFRQISDVTGGWTIRKYNDMLIEGTYTGIIFFKKDRNGKWTFRNKIKGFDEPTRHIEIDYLGYIWASHPQKGFYRLELDEALDSVIQVQYYSTISSRQKAVNIYKVNNQIVFATSDSLYTFDYDRRKIIPFTQLNSSLGEYKESVHIIPETKNRYWLIRDNRIALFNISKDFVAVKQLEFYHKASYLPERQIQIVKLSDKTILVPSRQAFITYNLSLFTDNADSSKPSVIKLVFNGKKKTFETAQPWSVPVRVPYYENNLTVFISDPSGFEYENKKFLYRLSGIDEEWHSTTSDRFSYLNLPHGTYQLRIKSETNDRVETVSFTVRRPWYISAVAFISYIILLAGLIYALILRSKKKTIRQRQLLEFEVSNSKLASELDFKSYELMLTMRYLIQKDEILTQLNDQINSLREQSSRFPVKFIREMDRIINQGHTQAEEWKNALKSLKLTQQGFFKKLIEKHPGLTPYDLRLCSYLQMNLSTKEIAKLLNISERAVEISRYRLRRKMHLDHNKNLTEYLIKEII